MLEISIYLFVLFFVMSLMYFVNECRVIKQHGKQFSYTWIVKLYEKYELNKINW